MKKVNKDDFTKKDIWKFGVLFAVILAVGLTTSAGAGFTLWDRIAQVAGDKLGTILGDKVSDIEVPEMFGAIPGSSIEDKVFSVGGVEFGHVKKTLTATSAIPCLIKNPHNATATLDKITFYAKTSFNAATTFDISTSSTVWASSSVPLVFARTISSSTKHSMMTTWQPETSSSTMPGTIGSGDYELYNSYYDRNNYLILGASEYITVRMATSVPGSETLSGTCSLSTRRLYSR